MFSSINSKIALHSAGKSNVQNIKIRILNDKTIISLLKMNHLFQPINPLILKEKMVDVPEEKE